MNVLLIGIDDTDNLESRGTGYRARMLARHLGEAQLGTVTGITRHQLLVDDAEQLRVSQIAEPVALGGGLSGSRIAYVGTFGNVQAPIEGEVTAVVSASGVGVVFDGWAPSGQLRLAIDDIRRMVETAEIA